MSLPESPPGDTDELRALAASHGIELRHEDGLEREVEPSTETLIRILRSLGASIESPSDAAELLRSRKVELTSRLLEPVSVAWTDRPPAIRSGPALTPGSRVEFEITPQGDGEGEPEPVRVGSAVATAEGIPLSGTLSPGYYQARVGVDGRWEEGLLIVSPPRAYGSDGEPDSPETTSGPRDWGVFLPLYAMRSDRDWGTGDLTDLGRLLRWTSRQGGDAVGTLPLMAAFLDEPLEPSPYSPASRRFWNELYLDPTRLPEWHEVSEARRLAASADVRRRIQAARESSHVEHREIHRLQAELLDSLAASWAKAGGETTPEFAEFLEAYPDAQHYAAFRATLEHRGESWNRWPERWRKVGIPDEAFRDDVRRRHLYAQFRFATQLTDVAGSLEPADAGLYLDLPLSTHPMGYDVWAHGHLFADGCTLGAPPDSFHPAGQNWGLPPLRPQAARRGGHGLFREVLRRLLPHARYLRIDHIMGLHRLYWIPAEGSGEDGAYVRYPADELYAILCLESHRHRTILVGEDLGTVPPEVRLQMDARGLKRMYVVPFEVSSEPSETFNPVPEGALATLNTHDLPPFAAALKDEGLRDRVEELTASFPDARPGNASIPEEHPDLQILGGILQWLGRQPAGLVVVNLEDLWLEERPQNEPGTTGSGNWRRKASLPFEEFSTDVGVLRTLQALHQSRTSGPTGAPPPQDPKVEPEEGDAPMEPEENPAQPANEADEDLPSPRISSHDLYLFNEGTHTRLYRKLGAHLSQDPAQPGVHFAVWAPSAVRVSVVGDFNGWDAGAHPMTPRENSGIWERFVPNVQKGTIYKFEILGAGGHTTVQKADPFGFRHEPPPATGSVVWDLNYDWGDGEWMDHRKEHSHHEAPISVYEMHLGSWRRDPENPRRLRGYRELVPELVAYLTELGFTHVELLPVTEHPFYGSWGYQTTGYFAPTSRYGAPQDFMYLVDQLHQAGIGVILDWVPSHFPSDEHGLAHFDGTHLFEHEDPRQGFHPDWESLIFNYGRHEVRSFLLSSALFWLDHYHVDGLRVDAVASMLYLDYSRKDGEWIPNRYGGRENLEAIDFLRRLNEEVYGNHPDVQTVAEESTAWPMVSRPTYVGGLGFGMKWDMGWMHDTLKFLARDPVHRKHHHDEITFRSIYAFNENFMLPLSHDEVVHGKGSLINRMPGDAWQKRANLRLLLAYQFLQAGKKLLFMGAELGQWSEWNHETQLDWGLLEDPAHAGIHRLVCDLNRLYRNDPALHTGDFRPEGFEWIEAGDRDRGVLAFLRKGVRGDGCPPTVAVFNLVPVPRDNHRIGVPTDGHWSEVLNTDAREYGGSGRGNLGGFEADPIPSHGHFQSLVLSLPPLGAVVLRAPEA